ncbi:MAG: sulfotransferase family protein, partial [Actinomycetota bacterium]|nr:sulfotransferase family protein [Actinomycetota bacterium]
MARRIFLHVGTPKTGTTYLQSVLWANKAVLKRQGALLPLKNVRDHFYLSVVARNAKGAFDRMPPHGQKSWQRMLREVAAWRGDVVISHELFAVASSARAAWTIHQLGDVSDEVHVIVTGRDFARQVPAEWQQTIKHGRHHRLDEYIELLKNHESGVLFW